MSIMNPEVDAFLGNAARWREAMAALRAILLDCQLTEEVKWGKPCYTDQGSNVAIIQGFKDYCALMFFKGALLRDAHGILVKPGERTQAGRQIRFTGVREVVEMEPVLKAYVQEAIEVERAGLTVSLRATEDYPVPDEFQARLDQMPALKTAFEALTPGRQRAYLLYFSAAKQSVTRASRIDKSVPRILDGKGLDD